MNVRSMVFKSSRKIFWQKKVSLKQKSIKEFLVKESESAVIQRRTTAVPSGERTSNARKRVRGFDSEETIAADRPRSDRPSTALSPENVRGSIDEREARRPVKLRLKWTSVSMQWIASSTKRWAFSKCVHVACPGKTRKRDGK